VYHLTAHCSIDRKGYGSIWCETTTGRSANDLASALVVILEMILQQHPAITKFVLWSDSCVAQNRNLILSFALQNFLHAHGTVECIEQKFCEPGHSSIQEVDNIHSHIEKVLSVTDIYSPLSLMRALLKVTPNRPLNLRQLKDSDFADYQAAAKQLRYSCVPFSKVKQLVYKNGEEYRYTVWYRTTFEEELKEAYTFEPFREKPSQLNGQSKEKKRNAKERSSISTNATDISAASATVGLWPVPEGLVSTVSISAEKKADIESMLKYMLAIDALCMQTVLSNIPISKAATKSTKSKKCQRVTPAVRENIKFIFYCISFLACSVYCT